MHPRPALARLRALGWGERAALAEAVFCLALARALVRLVPFRILAPRLGRQMVESSFQRSLAGESAGSRVRWAVAAAARRMPFRARCLEQAYAATMMLRRRGVPSTIYFGVAREGGALEAHAWVRSISGYVTGGANARRYAVVTLFGQPGREREASLTAPEALTERPANARPAVEPHRR